jgi:FkbM family methyltransferase
LGAGARAKQALHDALHAVGVDVVRYRSTVFPHLRRRELLVEQAIDVVLDVGANDGGYGRELRRDGFARRIVSFEPLSGAYTSLADAAEADPQWACNNVAVGREDGEALIHVAGNAMSSSLLPMGDRHAAAAPESRYVGSEQIHIVRLDTLRPQILGESDRVFLKIDVQGLELAVLDGAPETLRQVRALELELSLFPLYEGEPAVDDVLRRLDHEGFNLLSFHGGFREPAGQLLQVDGLFVRR